MAKLKDHKVLIFDVYGTLADWESGIYNALQPLLQRYPVSKAWTRKEALQAFMSVESDIQAKSPNLLYCDVLAAVHEVLEERLKALSGNDELEGSSSSSAPTSTLSGSTLINTTDSSTSTSTSATTQSQSDEHNVFGASIRNWPIFPDTCDALGRLAKHFKLVVLSNVDRESFKYTHALLSEGPTWDTVTSDITTYTYPDPNPHLYWHPQEIQGSISPFTAILTAQDTDCYKPSLNGFLDVLSYVRMQESLFPDVEREKGFLKNQVLCVAQSLPHDHVPASDLGIRSVWIDRQSAVTCNVLPTEFEGKNLWTWRFETLGELADAVEKEATPESEN